MKKNLILVSVIVLGIVFAVPVFASISGGLKLLTDIILPVENNCTESGNYLTFFDADTGVRITQGLCSYFYDGQLTYGDFTAEWSIGDSLKLVEGSQSCFAITYAECIVQEGFVSAVSVLIVAFLPEGGIITLPLTALADLTGNASQIIVDVWVLIALVIGIPLGFYIIKKVIDGWYPTR